MDWFAAFVQHYPTRVARAHPERLFSLLAELLSCTNDGHVELEADGSDARLDGCAGQQRHVQGHELERIMRSKLPGEETEKGEENAEGRKEENDYVSKLDRQKEEEKEDGGREGEEEEEGEYYCAMPTTTGLPKFLRGVAGSAVVPDQAARQSAADRWHRHATRMEAAAGAWVDHIFEQCLVGGAVLGQSVFMRVPSDHWLVGQPVLQWGWLSTASPALAPQTDTGDVAYLLLSAMDCEEFDSDTQEEPTDASIRADEAQRQKNCQSTTLHPDVAAALDRDLDAFFHFCVPSEDSGASRARAVVIDVRLNEGGEDAFARHVAARFVDQERPVYSKQSGTDYCASASRYVSSAAVSSGGARRYFSISPPPPPQRSWRGPTLLLVSEVTGSAAEVLALCLKAQPHVTLVGQVRRLVVRRPAPCDNLVSSIPTLAIGLGNRPTNLPLMAPHASGAQTRPLLWLLCSPPQGFFPT